MLDARANQVRAALERRLLVLRKWRRHAFVELRLEWLRYWHRRMTGNPRLGPPRLKHGTEFRVQRAQEDG